MKLNQLTISLVIIVVIVGALLAYQLSRPNPMDPRFSPCFAMMGDSSSIGIDVSTDQKSYKLTFGGKLDVPPATDPKQLEQFNRCIAMILGDGKTDMEILTQATPLGEALDHWRNSAASTTSGLVVTLDQPQDAALNNLLVVGKGPRWQVVSNWCQMPPLMSCVSCEPATVNAGTMSVQMSLNPARRTKQIDLGRAGPPTADPNHPYQPWEFVQQGERYGYSCTP